VTCGVDRPERRKGERGCELVGIVLGVSVVAFSVGLHGVGGEAPWEVETGVGLGLLAPQKERIRCVAVVDALLWGVGDWDEKSSRLRLGGTCCRISLDGTSLCSSPRSKSWAA